MKLVSQPHKDNTSQQLFGMASQYITFMIIFILGLNMVIITNSMFLLMSDQFQQNIAEVELSQILDLIETQILQTLLLPSDFNQTVEQQIELPTLIGRRYQYSIEISNSTDNQIALYGFTSNERISHKNTFSLGKKYSIKISESSFKSINSLLSLRIEKNVNIITITIS